MMSWTEPDWTSEPDSGNPGESGSTWMFRQWRWCWPEGQRLSSASELTAGQVDKANASPIDANVQLT